MLTTAAHARTRPCTVAALTVALACLTSSTARAVISSRDFALPAGTNPQSLATSDCDGDGAPDLVVANLGDDTVTIFHDDHGTFTLARTIHTQPQPSGAVCADVNGDGLIDLAVTSLVTGSVTVYLADMDGGFTAAGSTATGQQPRSVSAADFDRDGHVDLLVVNARSSGLTLLFGDGTGAFPFTSTLRLPANGRNRPLAATIGDFNHDRIPDIAVVGQGDPPLRLLLGDGLGFAVDDAALPKTADARSAASADFDHDGFADLAILSSDATVRLYRGGATRRFGEPDVLLLGTDARAVALADFDGNGLADLAVAYAKSNTVQVLLADGPGRYRSAPVAAPTIVNNATTLTPRGGGDEIIALDRATRRVTRLRLNDQNVLSTTQLLTVDGTPQTLTLTDLNGDGILDALLAVPGAGGAALQVRLGTAAGGFDAPPAPTGRCGDGVAQRPEICDDGNTAAGDGCSATCTLELGGTVLFAAPGDVDGDGRQDVVFVDGRGTILGLLGNGAGAFREVRKLAAAKQRTTIAVAPFQGAGTSDIVIVPPRGSRALVLLANDGSGHFTPTPLAGTDSLRDPFSAVDLDRNGFVDLVATAHSRRAFTALFNDGNGPVRAGLTRTLPAQVRAYGAADVDENGWPDLFTFFKRGKAAPAVYLAAGNGAFATDALTIGDASRADGAIADLNEDQHQDLIQCDGGSAGACTIAYGDGNGRFSATPPLDVSPQTGAYVGRVVRGVAAADFDRDGLVDLAGVSRRDNRAVVIYRQPDDAVPVRVELATGSKPVAIAAADLDGDGRPDLVVANEGSNDLSVFLNRGPRTFQPLARITLESATFKPSALAVGDVDGDGRLDVAVASSDAASVVVLQNRGFGGLVRLALLPTGASPQAVSLGDLNGDGLLDVVTADGNDDALSLLLSAGVGHWDRTSQPTGGLHPTDVALADLDADGTLDAVVVHEGSRTVTTLLNDGTGVLAPGTTTELAGRKRPWNLCAGDFDGDGLADVAVASLGTADVTVLRAAGGGAWTGDVRVYAIGEDPRPLWCGDVDGDGLDDVAFVRRRSGRVDAIVSGE